MKDSLKQKMFIAFLISSVVILTMMFSVTQYIIQREFTKYIEESHRKQDQDILLYLTDVINREGGLDTRSLLPIAHQSMMEGFLVTIYDEDENILWKTDEESNSPDAISEYHELIHPIEYNDMVIVYVGIARSHDHFFSPEDISFQRSLYKGLLSVAIISIIIAILYSFLISGQLATPITAIKHAANHLQQGNLKTRVHLESATREIRELGESINHLGASLERQETLRRRLTSDISHELRTPLNILQSHLEALIDGIWEPSPQRLKSCHSEVLRLTAIVKELEKLTQLDNDALQLKKESISLNLLLQEIVLQFQPIYAEKNIQLMLAADERIEAFIDGDKIRQVMINLLSNAYKFTSGNGKVEINLYKKNKRAVVTVEDNGIGIPEKDLPNIFERFYRSEPSRNRDSGGAGLGLSIAASIVKAHNGTITAQSIVGEGTQFTVKLPLA